MKKLLILLLFIISATICKAQAYYGMTYLGGDSSNGVIFSFDAATKQETVLHSFGNKPDGVSPTSDLVYDSTQGLFYGMTYLGGDSSKGAIISFDPSKNEEKVVYSFKGAPDGFYPTGNLIYNKSDSLFYGTTYGGGAANLNVNAGGGTIISFNPRNDSEKVLWSFLGPPNDGAVPEGSLVFDPTSGILYGTTFAGGDSVTGSNFAGAGAIISYNTATKQESLVWNFAGTPGGAAPYGSLVYDPVKKMFYGMTIFGGVNDTIDGGDGIIFSFDPSGNIGTQLWSFGSGTDGEKPYGNLTYDPTNNTLYGLCITGGANAHGAVISFDPSGNTENVAYSFMSAPDGVAPYGSLVYDATHDVFYGMTHSGGTNNSSGGGLGTIFSFDPSGNSDDVLWSFGGTNDGKFPFGSLTLYPPSAGAAVNQLSINNNQLSIYPNPTSGEFTVNLICNQNGITLEIYNVMGEKIYESVLSNSQNTINLANQPDGMYFVTVTSGNTITTGKILIIK